MIELLLPRTDAGALAQLLLAVGIGGPLLVVTLRRGSTELAWLFGGVLSLLLAFFAFRTVH